MFLNQYVKTYFEDYPRISTDEYGFKTFVVILVLLSFLFKLLPRKYYLVVPLLAVVIYTLMKSSGPQSYRIVDGGKTLLIKNSCDKPPLVDCVGVFAYRSLGVERDPSFKEIKSLACDLLNRSYWNVSIRLYSPHPRFPKRQIILNNHTQYPVKDSFAFFPFINRDSKLLVVQHNYNGVVNHIASKSWGAYVVDKDDKTKEGKARMNDQLQRLVEIMNSENDLTVVIYPQGKIPKTNEECRNPKTFYPGAFYLSLLTGYCITPIINDCSPEGMFTTIVKEPVDLLTEYRGRVDFSSRLVREFREHPENRELLSEICERFKNLYKSEYDLITKIEKGDG